MTASGRVSATTRSRKSPSSTEPTKLRIRSPEISAQASIRRSRSRIGVSESLPAASTQRRRAKLSTTVTSWPRAENLSAVDQPRQPSPPRMRTRIGRGRVADRGMLMPSAPTYNPGVADRFQRACGGPRWALFVAVVLIAGLGLRMEHAIRAPNEPVYDARAYARIAHSVYAGEGFTQGPEAGRRRR